MNFAIAKLRGLEAAKQKRALAPTVRAPGTRVRRGGRELVSFCCNDYFGLARDRRVEAAAIEAVRRYGAGAGASRLVTGDHPLLDELEARLAAFKGTEAARVFGSGYLANIGVIPALAGPGDLIVIDALAHACLFAGAKLSGARIDVFPHNDVSAAADALKRRGDFRHALLITETIFSMDGDRAPLEALGALAGETDAWLLTDDAHGLGILDPAENPAPLQVGTLSKAAGAYGGYLCAAAPVVELMASRARSFVYTTGLPPAAAGAAIKALEIIAADQTLREAPLAFARQFAEQIGPEAYGLAPPQSQIIPLILGSEARALEVQARLEADGFLVVAIRPPTVPDGEARLRISFSAAHRPEEVAALAAAIRRHVPPGRA
ncbi:MAG: 8-amino-7-oxononanoate synthase [Parvularculaceae bacterium]